MKVKLFLKQDTHYQNNGWDKFTIKSGFYLGEETPTIYDPKTFEKVEKSYIIKCLDNKYRKVYASHFITVEELRESKIKELGL
jgi:hypothetical protein